MLSRKCSRAMFLYSELGEFPWLWDNEHFPQMGFDKLQRDLQGTPNSHLLEFLVSAAPARSFPFCGDFQGLPVGFHVLSAVLSCWPLCPRICLKAVLPLRAELQLYSSFELTHNAHSRFRQRGFDRLVGLSCSGPRATRDTLTAKPWVMQKFG